MKDIAEPHTHVDKTCSPDKVNVTYHNYLKHRDSLGCMGKGVSVFSQIRRWV